MLDNVDSKVQRTQWMLYAEASHNQERRFKQVYRFLKQPWWVAQAINDVLRNQGSRTAGIDGKTRSDYSETEQFQKLMDSIIEDISTGTYSPQPVRRIYIKKANGKMRPLGIPTIRDRVVQQMVRMLLEPIYEGTFLPCSYGFRPNRCTWDAIAEARRFLTPKNRYYTIIEGDITDCFGTIQHGTLMTQLKRRILDKRLLSLIWGMLQAGYMEDLKYHESTEGTTQGGIASPLLANVYLHRLDEWMHYRFHAIQNHDRERLKRHGEIAYVRYIRYADDFVVLTRDSEHAEALKQEISEYLASELKMNLSPEKTLITQAQDGFNFLGVRIITFPQKSKLGRMMPYVIPADKSVQAFRQKVKEITHRRLDYVQPAERIKAINRLILGWANYHHWGNSKETFTKLTLWTSKKVLRMLERSITPGRRNAYIQHIKPIADCINLKRWKKYTVWRTPAINLGAGAWYGLIPIAIISTKECWYFRGGNIPPAYQPLNNEMDKKGRDTSILTDLDVIQSTKIHDVPRNSAKYDVVYFVNRKRTLQRDQYTCVVCGYKSQRQQGEEHDLEVHHINPSDGNGLDNLQTVCLPCHRKLTTLEQAD